MSAQGNWRVDEGGFANSIGRVVLSNEGRFVGIMSRSDAEAIVAGMNARAVVAAHNAQCEAEPVAWFWWSSLTDRWTQAADEQCARYWAERDGSGEVLPLCRTAPPPPASAVAEVEELRDRLEAEYRLSGGFAQRCRRDTADEIIRVLKEAGL